MPQGNRTGPEGAGPMTGRAMGYCTDTDGAGFEMTRGGQAGSGMGAGRRFGRGGPAGFGGARPGADSRGGGRSRAGRGPSYWNEGEDTPETRDALLRQEIDLLSNRLEFLQRRLDARTTTPDTPAEDQ